MQREYYAPDGTLRVKAVTRVYEKGIDYIRRLLDAYLLSFVEKQTTGY